MSRLKKTTVNKVKVGSIVRFQGDWGVLEGGGHLDRWLGGPIRLRRWDVVEILLSPKPGRRDK